MTGNGQKTTGNHSIYLILRISSAAYLTQPDAEQALAHIHEQDDCRRALSQDGGDPVLLGLIRASHLRDAAGEAQWAQQVRCPGGSTP